MTLYVDEEYYYNVFMGKISNIKQYLELAQEKINSITFNRIVAIGFNNLTNFQKDKIMKAICYQAEYINENGFNNEDDSDISSYSVLDISVNVQLKDINSKTKAELECMSEMAYNLIHQTGLDSRNWRFNG